MTERDFSQLTDAQLEAIAQGQNPQSVISGPGGPAPGRQPEPPGTVGDVLRAIPAGMVRGAAGILGVPGMINQLAQRGFDATVGRAADAVLGPLPEDARRQMLGPAEAVRNAMTPSGIQRGYENVTGGPLYEPQTGPGRIAGSAAEWGTGAAIGPLRGLPLAIALGASGGAASGGLDEFLNSRGYAADSWQRRILPPAAGVATSVGLGIPFARRGAPGDIVERRMEGVTPQGLNTARERLAEGDRIGVRLTPAEALGDEGAALQQLTGNVAASPQGGQLASALRGRQNQVTNAIRGPGGFLEGVSPDVSTAAPMAARTAASSPLYQQAARESIDPAGLGAVNVLTTNVVQPVRDAAYEAGANNPLGRQLNSYSQQLVTPEVGEQTMRVGPLQTLAQNTRDGVLPSTEAMAGADRAALGARLSGSLAPQNEALVRRLEELNPTFAEAQNRFRALSPRVNAAGIREGFDQVYERALQSGSTRATNPTVGAQLAQALRGREGGLRGAEFDDAIRIAARAAGRNEDDAVTAANRFMDTLAQTARIPGVGSETAPRAALTAEARQNLMATIMSLPRDLAGTGPLSNALRNMGERGTYGRLSGALAPGGAQSIDDLLALAGRGVPARQGALSARALTTLEAPGRVQERRR